jgi:hypothetical protein
MLAPTARKAKKRKLRKNFEKLRETPGGWRAMLDTGANYSFEIPIKKPRRRNTTDRSLKVSRFVDAGDDRDSGR